MHHTCHVECSLHREVEVAAAANLLVVAHYAYLALPVFQVVLGQRVAQTEPDAPHGVYGRVCPVAVAEHYVGYVWQSVDRNLCAVFCKQRAYGVAPLPSGHVCAEQASDVGALV